MKKRSSNLEALRIISMYLIVMSHCDDILGIDTLYQHTIGINKIITDWLHIGGQIGVGCFVLISGYFMVDQKFTVKRILKTAGTVWFYSISIWLIWIITCVLTGRFVIKKIIIGAVFAFFPILSSHYWFATAYIILLLLAPFFNLLINAMERNQYKYLLICIISIFVIIEGGIPYALYQMFDGRLVPMIIYYFIAGYIKRFVTISEISSYKCISIAAAFYILLWMSSYFITYIGYLLNNETIMGACYFYRRINSPIVVIIAVALFIGFLSLKIEENILVNTVAISTFGVYLLHGNRIILNYLTVYISSIADDVKNPIIILLYAILLPSGIYVVCTVVDWIRQKTVGKLWSLLIDRKSRFLDTKCRSVIEGLLRKCALLGKVVCVNEVKNI